MPAPTATSQSIIRDLARINSKVRSHAKDLVSATAHNVQVRRSLNVQNISNNSASAIVWDTTDFLSSNYTISFAGNPFLGGVTVNHTGWYKVSGSCEFAANATGRRFLTVYRNAAEVVGYTRHQVPVNSGTDGTGLVLQPRAILCQAGDLITLGVYQNSGITLAISANAVMLMELLPN